MLNVNRQWLEERRDELARQEHELTCRANQAQGARLFVERMLAALDGAEQKQAEPPGFVIPQENQT